MNQKKYLLFFLLLYCQIQLLSAQTSSLLGLNCGKNLPNLAFKLQSESTDSITVGFIGGSITETNSGWRDQTMDMFIDQYPDKRFKQINAGISGTGSSLGVYRINEQVLQYNPDLIFIEFAVNDYKESKKTILEAMEGMVRKTWEHNKQTDICFVYTFSKDMLETYQKGFKPYSVLAMEEIASHYQIPSINFASDILKKLNNNTLFLTGSKASVKDSIFFSGDGVHPYPETGHRYYTKTVSASLKVLLQSTKKKKHKLPSVYFSDALVNTRMIDVEDDMIKNVSYIEYEGADERKKFSHLLPHIKVLDNQQSYLSFNFTGNKIGFLDIIGPSSTQLKVEIDKDAPRYITRFDRFCSFTRMHWFFIEDLSEGKHQIKISIQPNKIDKFKILDKQPSQLNNPATFGREVWQVGKILSINTAD